MPLSARAVKGLMIAMADRDLGLEVVNAINEATAAVPTAKVSQVIAVIIATNVSQTIDFAVLAVGDQVAMIPAVAGNADQIGPIAVAGNLGQAAVVGNMYIVTRVYTNPTDDATKF